MAASTTHLPPGPSLPAPLQLLAMSSRPGPWLLRCRERYGDFFTLRTSRHEEMVFVSDPAAIKQIFTADPAVLHAGVGRVGLRPMFGERSILLLDGAEHLRERKLMLPPFHGDRMAGYGELMTEIAEREVAAWPVGEPVALQERMQAVTLEVILRAVFGMDEDRHLDEMRRAIRRLLGITASPVAYLFVIVPALRRGPADWGLARTRAAADRLIFDQIARRRRDPALAERTDILSLFLQARDEDGRPMSDQQVRDELVTLLLAGHETTATGLAWTFDALWRHPDKLERLTAECAEYRERGGYLDAVIKEALRLRPPLPITDRTVMAPFELAGRRFDPGTRLAACIYLVHRRPDLYPDPHAFVPERFLERAPETYSWLPFGGGVRRCLGASFATFEMKVVLSTILRRVRLAGASDRAEPTRRRSIVLAPAHGAPAVVRERMPVAA